MDEQTLRTIMREEVLATLDDQSFTVSPHVAPLLKGGFRGNNSFAALCRHAWFLIRGKHFAMSTNQIVLQSGPPLLLLVDQLSMYLRG